MGVSDKLWVKLVCPECGAAEVSSALDKGSGWSGQHCSPSAGFGLSEVLS